jgi:surfeit locus 1 family protein
MSELTQHQANVSFQWQWNWKVLVFTAIFLPITVSLALWQLDRADEKRQLLEMYHQRGIAQPVALEAVLDQSGSEYLRVRVTGTYDNRSPLLLDNRVRRGRPGYEVISPFKTSKGQWILVNRGWIMGHSDRAVLPKIDDVGGEVTLMGYLYRSPGKQLMLGEDLWQVEVGPKIIQNAAPDVVAEKLKLALFSYSLRLDADVQGALETGWALVSVQPGKHTGYAVQWTALAVVLMVLTFFANSNLGVVISARRRMNREKISHQ